MKINKLTIEIELKNNILVANCNDLNCSASGEFLGKLLENLQEELDLSVLNLVDNEPEKVNTFIKSLFGAEETGDIDKDFDMYIEQIRYSLFREKLDKAFLLAYPKSQKYIPILPIPYVFWDGGEKYESDLERERLGYEGLINNGKNDRDWIDFVQWIAVPSIKIMLRHQQREKYDRWKEIGLPLPSFEAILRTKL